MDHLMEHADIVVYAVIAAVILARLWMVLGRRNEGDPQKHNPYAAMAAKQAEDEDAPFQIESARKAGDEKPAFSPLLIAPMSLLGALEQIRQHDPAFDEKAFLRDVRALFTDIVTAFAKGNLADVETRLNPSVRANFQTAIDARANAGETLDTRIGRIADVETTAARVENNCAFVTVRIVSEQENIIRDRFGRITGGEPGRIEEITDIWTFMRDMGAAEKTWQLVETRS
ncbi:MAG: Tim44/TimA family putative adaptor protein [Bdellovibrionales bacterium]